MTYTVLMTRRAQGELSSLMGPPYIQVKRAMESLAIAPRGPGCRKLRGREGWRLRVGRFRVLYEIDDKVQTVTIVRVGHRREIYR